MEVLYFLVPISLGLVGIGIALFVWAVRNGQMDDLEGPGHSILYEDDEEMIPTEARKRGSGTSSAGGAQNANGAAAEETENLKDR